MKAELREEFRERLLALLATKNVVGMKLAALQVHLRVTGFDVEDRVVLEELDYLVGKGLAETIDKKISPENPRWKLTAEGRDYVAARALD